MKRFVEPILHSIFWCLLVYIANNTFGVRVIALKIHDHFEMAKQYDYTVLAILLIDTFFKLILFYICSFFLFSGLSKSNQRRRKAMAAGLFVVTLMGSVGFNYLILQNHSVLATSKSNVLFGYMVLFHLLILFFAIGYRLARDWFKNEKINRQIQEEKLQTELDFLKSQINPHFLFNTLNNLFAEARKHKIDSLSNGIAKLSHIMRYMIYDSNVEFVSLGKEVEYLRSYIELQMLRISKDDPFDLKMDIGEIDSNVSIAPILFIPFVENAFKHGVKLEEGSFIHIALSVENGILTFKVENSQANNSNVIEHSGIGLSNIRRRLSLIYPDRHELDVETSVETFKVVLTIKL